MSLGAPARPSVIKLKIARAGESDSELAKSALAKAAESIRGLENPVMLGLAVNDTAKAIKSWECVGGSPAGSARAAAFEKSPEAGPRKSRKPAKPKARGESRDLAKIEPQVAIHGMFRFAASFVRDHFRPLPDFAKSAAFGLANKVPAFNSLFSHFTQNESRPSGTPGERLFALLESHPAAGVPDAGLFAFSAYLKVAKTAAAPAWATSVSFATELPETPMAPMMVPLLSFMSSPPPKITMPSLVTSMP